MPRVVLEVAIGCIRARRDAHREWSIQTGACRGWWCEWRNLRATINDENTNNWPRLTARISVTRNHSPLPLRPLSATIAPGKKPAPCAPFLASRTLTLVSNLRGTRFPDPIARDVSRIIDASFSFTEPADEASASSAIRPTTTISS